MRRTLEKSADAAARDILRDPAFRADIKAIIRRGRGPQKAPRKQAVSIRLSPEILAHYRPRGRGWQTQMNDDLLKLVKRHAR